MLFTNLSSAVIESFVQVTALPQSQLPKRPPQLTLYSCLTRNKLGSLRLPQAT